MKLMRSSIIALGAVALMLSGCAQATEAPERNDSGEITAATDNADILKITVGDCLDVKPKQGSIDRAAVKPCDETHVSEVFASFKTADAKKYPGANALEKEANSSCLTEFEDFVGLDYNESKLEYWPIFPSNQSWDAGDRETLCVVTNPASNKAGTLAGAEI